MSKNLHASSLHDKPISLLYVERLRHANLSRFLQQPLDRVNVLGGDSSYGHTGCVNALSWEMDGRLLLSGGDDTTIRLWHMDSADSANTSENDLTCGSVLNTGHRANIFNVHLLPQSSRIVTAAGDKQIRVFDIESMLNSPGDRAPNVHNHPQSCTHVFRCHEDRVKRIVTEDSQDLFLTVSEDGTVRQHDLRTSHLCGYTSCPQPLVQLHHELSTLSLSSLTPFQFVVAGESPCGYLFDRRHLGRVLQEEWGELRSNKSDSSITTCVRRFGRPQYRDHALERNPRHEHITGVRMSNCNGHELIMSYSGDGIYLYSTRDEPEGTDDFKSLGSSSLIPNLAEAEVHELGAYGYPDELPTQMNSESNDSDYEHSDTDERRDMDENFEALFEFDETPHLREAGNHYSQVPVIYPRRRYVGACNVATIKDVNFIGPTDELVTSGSDGGNFFIWEKSSGALHGIYKGDSVVVNVIEGHPYLPMLAVSGIDTTIKIFAPSRKNPSVFSRMHNAHEIIKTNAVLSRTRVVRVLLEREIYLSP